MIPHASSLVAFIIVATSIFFQHTGNVIVSALVIPRNSAAEKFQKRYRSHHPHNSKDRSLIVLHGSKKRKKKKYVATPDNSDTKNDDSSGWTLDQDWILMDQVPKFTIGSNDNNENNNQRTFWTQLGTCTPTLSVFSDKELELRYQTLKREHKIISSSKVGGPSPPILQNWSMEEATGRVHGQLQDSGRMVWFTSHVMGRFDGDPMTMMENQYYNTDTTDFFQQQLLLPGGYVEAVGGRVYELGQPKQPHFTENQNDMEKRRIITSLSSNRYATATADINHKNGDNNSNYREKFLPNLSWISATTATMSALVASAILSAAIGYGAGLSIISDSSSHHSLYSLPQETTTTTTPVNYVSSSQTTPLNSKVEISISEKRAKAEAKVLREQRFLKTVSDKLERDQAELQILRFEEAHYQQQQPSM